MTFVHLHTHTEYSMLDSTIRVADLVARAQADGAPAIAMTDHNNMFGAVEFFKAARKADVKPILGAEVDMVDEDRRAAEPRRTTTLVLLCENDEGYRNLCYLLSRAYMDSPPRLPRPRIDLPLLRERATGLVALSSSLAGAIPQALLRGSYDDAAAVARVYQGIFPDAFYLELLRNGIAEQERVNAGLLRLSEELGIPLVAAADAHYAKREDAEAHELLMCIQLGKSLPSLESRARVTDELHLAPAEEMAERFADLPEAVANTLRVAERCNVELDLGHTYLPNYQVPEGHDAKSFLRAQASEGLQRRLAQARAQGLEPDEAVYQERLEYELGIIEQMGFPGYFLIVWDFINYAKEHGIPVGPGRGSGAGSLVAYSLRITDIDPIRYTLLFERFLNPERVSMPDFDVDFCMNKRDRVIAYVTQKYGEDNVGQIITYGKMKAKAVVRDVARVLGLTFGEADRAAKLIPDDLGMTLAKAFEMEPRLGALREEDPRYGKLFDVALTLEGLNRQPGMHAAGVVIGDKPLWEYVPLYAVVGDDGTITRITQFAKSEVEEAGLVKFDFLGLKTLTVIDHAMRIINDGRAAQGEEPLDISTIPLDDPGVFELISSGDTTGVFQLESSGFKELLRKLKPDCLEDIIAAVALYRPGPLQSGMVDSFVRRKHGQEPVTYPHPWLEDTLKETYGVMVYQEQVMQAASVLAGFSLGQADILRRAMGKKKVEAMKQQREVFAKGCAERGVPADQAREIFDTIEKFAGYGFNKSHSAAYGLITYQTAWLKTHYPVEFMAALLTSDGDNTDKVVRFISEARAMGITVLPPSVNESAADFTAVGGAIRFGLGAVKGVGGGAVEAILAAREEEGRFGSLFDFCERVDLRRVNKRVAEALVKCGAFDDFGAARATLFASLDKAFERGAQIQRDKAAGQMSMFDLLAAPPQAGGGGHDAARRADEALELREEWPDKQRLGYEKESLGFYVSGHPLDRYASELGRLGCTPISELARKEHRAEVQVGAVVSALRERPLKSGDGRMAFVTLEDLTGQVEVLCFSAAYAEAEEIIKGDEPVLLTATVQHEGEGEERSIKLRCNRVSTLRAAREASARWVRVHVRAEGDAAEPSPGMWGRLAEIAEGAGEGALGVEVVVEAPGLGSVRVRLGDGYRVGLDDASVSRVERLFGRDNVRFV